MTFLLLFCIFIVWIRLTKLSPLFPSPPSLDNSKAAWWKTILHQTCALMKQNIILQDSREPFPRQRHPAILKRAIRAFYGIGGYTVRFWLYFFSSIFIKSVLNWPSVMILIAWTCRRNVQTHKNNWRFVLRKWEWWPTQIGEQTDKCCSNNTKH